MPVPNLKCTGRHSKDRLVAIYLPSSNVIIEDEREDTVQQLHGVVYTRSPEITQVGVLAKIIGGRDGLGEGVYSGTVWGEQEYLDLVLKEGLNPTEDKDHYRFTLTLPQHCPPTINKCVQWYAYVECAKSKAYIAFDRVWMADPLRARTIEPSAGRVHNQHLILDARLDRSCYYSGDTITAHVKLSKPLDFKRFRGFKLTVKQVLSAKVSGSTFERKRRLNQVSYGKKWTMATTGRSVQDAYSLTRDINDSFHVQLDPGDPELLRYAENGFGKPFLDSSGNFAASFTEMSFPPNPRGRRLQMSLSYYVNVHVKLSWSADLIVSLPFSICARVDDTALMGLCEGGEIGGTRIDDQQKLLARVVSFDDLNHCDLQPMPALQDIQEALSLLDGSTRHTVLPTLYPKDISLAISSFHNVALNLLLRGVDPKANPDVPSIHARRLALLALNAPINASEAEDALCLLFTRLLDSKTLTMARYEEAMAMVKQRLQFTS